MAGIAAQGPANSLSGVHWHPRGDFKLSDCDCDCDRDFNDTANTMSRGGFNRMAAVVQRSPEAYRKLVLLGLQRGFAINASAMELNNDGAVRGEAALLTAALGSRTVARQDDLPARVQQLSSAGHDAHTDRRYRCRWRYRCCCRAHCRLRRQRRWRRRHALVGHVTLRIGPKGRGRENNSGGPCRSAARAIAQQRCTFPPAHDCAWGCSIHVLLQ